ncbi:MAG: rhomboid family intramembrane serine protease [Burkholderiales bacterium]|nr:rhomboid family intramembrane serine protease [Burkholderiales bacterium]
MPPVTQALLGINIICYAISQMLGYGITVEFGLWPLDSPAYGDASPFRFWQLITYGFLHGSLAHLLFNMLGLYMLGAQVEQVFGSQRYLQYYLTSVFSAAVAQLLVTQMLGGDPVPTVGASGGVFGLLLAYGMLFPNRTLMLLIPPIPMKARTFVLGYGAIELVLGLMQPTGGVAHFAHLGGAAGGFLLLQYWRGRWPFAR